MRRLLGFVVIAATFTYFFDPQNGRRRRALARDRIGGMLRRKLHQAERTGRGVQADVYGATQKVKNLRGEEKPQPDDVTLAHKVETEIFRDPEIPKGQINVNAEHGKIVLRGEVDSSELIDDLEKRARKVQGVQDVQNLLHLPGVEAPASS